MRADLYVGETLVIVPTSMLKVARVVGDKNDPDFVTLEVGKNDQVQFTIQEGDDFYTVVFLEQTPGGVQVWDPFEENVRG